jgi:hypothetical protein
VLTEEGVPVTGVRNMAFLFWSDAACTAPVAEAFVDNVPLTDGLFSTGVDVPQDIGGGHAELAGRALSGTLGQPVVGVTGSEVRGLCAGFWCLPGIHRYRIYVPLVLRDY